MLKNSPGSARHGVIPQEDESIERFDIRHALRRRALDILRPGIQLLPDKMIPATMRIPDTNPRGSARKTAIHAGVYVQREISASNLVMFAIFLNL